MLKSLEAHYRKAVHNGCKEIIPLWLSHSTIINRQITVSQQGSTLCGVVKGLSPQGGLILQSNGSEQTLFAGDVTILEM